MLYLGMYNLNSHSSKPSKKIIGNFDHQMMIAYVKMVTHDVPKDATISIPFALLTLFGVSFTTAGVAEVLEINKKDND